MILIKGKKPLICIDPGHGGQDTGALGPTGEQEAQLNFQIAKELMYQLELLNIDSYLTRTNNEFVKLSHRTDVRDKTTCFVSIHCNSFNNRMIEGIETIYHRSAGKHKALANYIQQSLIKNCQGHKNRGIKMSPSKDYPRKLYVLETAKVPTCLIECEFLSHQKWEKWLSSNEGQKQIAHAIAQGINSFLYSLPGGQSVDVPEQRVEEFLEDEFFINEESITSENSDNQEEDV